MSNGSGIQTGVLEHLCPISGSLGEWLAVIDGERYITWPDATDHHDASRCRHFVEGGRVRYSVNPHGAAGVPTGRRAACIDVPAMITLIDLDD